ncbi:MAG: phosphatidylcholine/phosphatidylserine synthase [Aestuariivirga sp.]|uniref:CDP-alcohol phosphatidyltransferase family protein n=1 Tax=Aestuariivirga sp. TaxID=2650926 RepID=UPI00301698B6
MERETESVDQAVGVDQGQRRFRMVPVRFLLPNMITLLALCSGVTAIRFAFEGRYELAVASVMLAVVLDAVDGRLARFLKGTSRFGAELDSLADFVNFGVAPAILLYVWSLNSLRTLGWVICLVLAICCALRLARFNVALDDPNKPAWANRFFTGAPAPAGAGLALLPFYLGFLGIIDEGHGWALLIGPYIVCVALLMVSRVPTFSGKHMGRIRGDMVLPVLGLAVLAVVMLISYPWEFLSIVSVIYLALIPVSIRSYRKLSAGVAHHKASEPPAAS